MTEEQFDVMIDALRASLREMLDAYWGAGDGEPPPAFVQRAIDLSMYRPDEHPLLQMGEELRPTTV